MYMVKNLFFLDIKNNAIIESNLDHVSKSNNPDLIQINYASKISNNKKDLVKNVYDILKTHNLDYNHIGNYKNLYINDGAVCLLDKNNKITCYGDKKYGGECLYSIIDPLFVIPTTTRFISQDLKNIYLWGTMNYTFNDIDKYLRFSVWNIIVNKNNTHYVFSDNKNKLITLNGNNIKNDVLNNLFALNRSDEITKYVKLFLANKILDKISQNKL